jgi:hypothetical protein
MEHIRKFEKRNGCDVGYHSSNIHPADGEGRVGARGIDKNLTLVQLIEIAYKMEEKPNILVKAGPNAKWYIKKFDSNIIDEEIEKQRKWRDISKSTMYIIEWDME